MQHVCCMLLAHRGGVDLAQCLLEPDPDPLDPSPDDCPQWCRCGCCTPMPTPTEEVCCKRTCITSYQSFSHFPLTKLCYKLQYIIHVITDSQIPWTTQTITSERLPIETIYYLFILWAHGHLGYRNRRVVLSCVVRAGRRYPDPHGQYLGFRPYWHNNSLAYIIHVYFRYNITCSFTSCRE